MTIRIQARALLLLVPVLLAGTCENKTDTAGESTCDSITANGGADQSVALGDTVTLSGEASELCPGDTGSWAWSFSSVPVESGLTDSDFSYNNSDTAVETTFEPDVVGTYVVELVVSNDTLSSAPDVVVVDVYSDNEPPVADCGDDVSIEVGYRVDLDGSESYDPEGVDLTWSWALSSLPGDSSLDSDDLYNAGGATPTVVPDVVGTYVVSLTVSDDEQWSDPDYCTITAASDNQEPVADAGDGATLPPCTDEEIELDGYGSYDPEGADLEYLWGLVSSPSGSSTSDDSFDDTSSANPTFTWDVAGEYAFQLEVSDGEYWSAPDVVIYTITDPDENTSPVANAGSDQTIEETAECSGSSYTELVCDDCEESTVELDGSGSYDPDGDDISYYWSESSGELSFDMPYSAYTETTTPEVPAEYDTTTTSEWTVNLDVADCEFSATDTMTITYECTGERS